MEFSHPTYQGFFPQILTSEGAHQTYRSYHLSLLKRGIFKR